MDGLGLDLGLPMGYLGDVNILFLQLDGVFSCALLFFLCCRNKRLLETQVGSKQMAGAFIGHDRLEKAEVFQTSA